MPRLIRSQHDFAAMDPFLPRRTSMQPAQEFSKATACAMLNQPKYQPCSRLCNRHRTNKCILRPCRDLHNLQEVVWSKLGSGMATLLALAGKAAAAKGFAVSIPDKRVPVQIGNSKIYRWWRWKPYSAPVAQVWWHPSVRPFGAQCCRCAVANLSEQQHNANLGIRSIC